MLLCGSQAHCSENSDARRLPARALPIRHARHSTRPARLTRPNQRRSGRRYSLTCVASLPEQLSAHSGLLSSSLKAACTVSTLAAFVYVLRPRGWADTDLLRIEASQIDRRGVFSRRPIPAGTVLGAYPGFARPPAEMAAKVARHPNAGSYVFATDAGWFLDPTDSRGRMRERRLWGLVPPHLAFVNEPQVGQTTNLTVQQGRGDLDLLYVAATDIPAGQELLIDYGRAYDRSGYARSSQADGN